MSVLYYLRQTLDEKIKEEGRHYKIDEDHRAFATVYDNIGHALESWPSYILDMLNIRYWRIASLRQPDGSLRKPRIFLNVEITSKDNLVLEWFPWPIRHYDLENTDWLYWSDNRPPGSGMTANRIIMIHDFRTIQYPYQRPFKHSETYVFEALHHLLKLIYDFLGTFFDVTFCDNLYLEYDDPPHWSDRKLRQVRIRKVEDVEREREQTRRDHWFKQTFERLKISPEQLLLLLKNNEMKLTKTVKDLRIDHSAKIGETALKTILTTLYQDFPVVYDKILSEPPKGVSPRIQKVVELFPNRISSEHTSNKKSK